MSKRVINLKNTTNIIMSTQHYCVDTTLFVVSTTLLLVFEHYYVAKPTTTLLCCITTTLLLSSGVPTNVKTVINVHISRSQMMYE